LGGAPFNVAAHLKMLGEHSEMISRVGKDTLGDQIKKRMKTAGLSTEYLQTDLSYQTGIVEVELDTNGNASYEIVQPVAWDFVEVNKKALNFAKNADAIIFGSLAQRHPITEEAIHNLLDLKKFNVFDVNLRPPFDEELIVRRSLQKATLVKLNDDEVKVLSKWFKIFDDHHQFCKLLSVKFKLDGVCITRGANGAALFYEGKFYEHPGFKVDVKDTVGSGDSFLAALLSKLLNKINPAEALDFANRVGAFVAQNNGATPKLNFDIIENIGK
ncbi:MAG: carbohydrate kinase, partial [Melioribacteraceae bacterium]|nr:carbohydrate kinase [Melioribacteraceae bacterium]